MQLWRLEYVRDRMRLDNLCLCLPIRMSLCVHSCMLRGSKTWLVKKENEFTLGWEWLGGCVILKTDRFSSSELREILGIDDMITLMQRHKLRLTCTCFKKGWECCCSFGHGSSLLWTLMLRPFYNRPIAVAQEGRSDWLKKWMDCEVEYVRSKGRPKKTWTEVMEKDCQLCKEDAMDHRKWRKLIKDVVYTHTNTHTHNRFTAIFPGPPRWAGATREVLDFMVQGKINRGTDHPSRRHSIRNKQCPPPPSPFFTGWMPFLPPNQQCQITEGNNYGRPME